MSFAPDHDHVDSDILLENLPHLKAMNEFVHRWWDAGIVEVLKPVQPIQDKDTTVVDKTRSSAFWGTDLAKPLQESGISQLIVSGVGTNVLVELTVRDSFTNGIHAIVNDARANAF